MKKLSSDQGGIVSILVTVVFILLLSMIVLAMAQNSNREQRQALDRQLSDQAFYNAESGINDWAKYLYDNAGASPNKPNCDLTGAAGTFPGSPPSSGDIDGDVNSYTCVTYDKVPKSIEIKPLTTNSSKLFKIKPQTGSIRGLKFVWKADNAANSVAGCNANTTSLITSLPGGCNMGVIRFELFNAANGRDNLIRSNYIGFIGPSNGAGSNMTYTTAYPNNQGVLGVASCNATDGCTAYITGLNIPAASEYYLNLKSMYADAFLTVTGYSTDVIASMNATTAQGFTESQIMIDSTGRANDVLRRVQVRLPYEKQYDQPGTGGSDVLATKESICKLIDVDNVDSTATDRCP